MSLIQLAVLAGIVLVLGLFVIRPVLTSQAKARLIADLPQRALPVASTMSLPSAANASGEGGLPVLTGEIEDSPAFGTTAPAEADPPMDPVTRLRRLIEERQAESVEILRAWMEQDEERA